MYLPECRVPSFSSRFEIEFTLSKLALLQWLGVKERVLVIS
jgi:hypothetical protein